VVLLLTQRSAIGAVSKSGALPPTYHPAETCYLASRSKLRSSSRRFSTVFAKFRRLLEVSAPAKSTGISSGYWVGRAPARAPTGCGGFVVRLRDAFVLHVRHQTVQPVPNRRIRHRHSGAGHNDGSAQLVKSFVPFREHGGTLFLPGSRRWAMIWRGAVFPNRREIWPGMQEARTKAAQAYCHVSPSLTNIGVASQPPPPSLPMRGPTTAAALGRLSFHLLMSAKNRNRPFLTHAPPHLFGAIIVPRSPRGRGLYSAEMIVLFAAGGNGRSICGPEFVGFFYNV